MSWGGDRSNTDVVGLCYTRRSCRRSITGLPYSYSSVDVEFERRVRTSVAGKLVKSSRVDELVSTRSNEFCRVQLTSSIELVPEIGGQSDSCISWVINYRTSRNFGRMRLRRSLPALAKHVKYDQSTIRSHEYSQLASCIEFNSTRLTWSSWRAWQASRVRNEFNSTCQQN